MSAWFGYVLNIEIVMKNHMKIKTSIDWEDREGEGAIARSKDIENISSGKELLRAIATWYDAYGEYYGESSESYSWGCENEDKILALEDFSMVEKIVLREESECYIDPLTTRNQLIISSKNNNNITDEPLYSDEELKAMKVNIPESVIKIGDAAFNGCSNFTFIVKEGSYAEKYADKLGKPYISLLDSNKEKEEDNEMIELAMSEKTIVGPTVESLNIFEGNAEEIAMGDLLISILRVVTANKIYIFKISTNNYVTDPSMYLRNEDGKLIEGDDIEIKTVSELATALMFMVNSSADEEIMKLVLDLKTGHIKAEAFIDSAKALLPDFMKQKKELEGCSRTDWIKMTDTSIDVINASLRVNLSGSDSAKADALWNAIIPCFRRADAEFEPIFNVAVELVNDVTSLKNISVVEAGLLDMNGEWGDDEEEEYIDPFDVDCEVNQEELLGEEGDEKMYIDCSELI